MSYRLGVDIGGTFTDLVIQSDSGGIHTVKVPSTPDDPSPRRIKARLLAYAGQPREGYEALTSGPLDAPGELAAAQAVLPLDPRCALEHADRAAVL